MEGIGFEIAKNEAQSLVNFVKGQGQYFCCFSSYAATFDQKKEALEPKLLDVNRKIEKARGVSCVTYEAWQWTREVESLINFDTRKEKCFSDLCLNCWRQYQKGKDLAEKIQQIDGLLGRCDVDIEAGAADLPGLKYHSLPNFMHFESRKSTFQDLKKTLEYENCNMIGLQGLGGTGKTSMAIQVGDELEGSEKFDKVIFLVVSQPPDFKKIRLNLAKQLDLELKEGQEEKHSENIWSKISNMKQKLLIILDDVWEEIDLKQNLGIPSSHQHKGCNVLITTRNLHVCTSMGCQKTIEIQTLIPKDALDLFLAHANITDTSHGLRGVAEKLVKRCGGVPVAIVAIARALKNRPLNVWKVALKTLEKHDANQSLTEAYKCIKLSYDNLKNEESKEIFLISSLFPEDFEIPMQLLSKIAIGLGLYGEVDRYHSVESKVHEAILELIDSSLFLTGNNEERVKIHDLVREVALWIGEKGLQWVMNSETHIKENLRYLAWKNDGFPNEFNGKKLEILMIFLIGSKDLKVPRTFFEEMKCLKVLYLSSDDEHTSAPTLLYSLQSLTDLRTLKLLNLKLDDISLVGKLRRLECLSLCDCSIIELPKEIMKLKKLRLLEVEGCTIELNNPFEVIERCSQLEDLNFVNNVLDSEKACGVSENLYPNPSLQRYKISQWNVESIYKTCGFSFAPYDLRNLITEASFKQFVRVAEYLILGEYKETGWKNLIPDIVPMEDGGMNDLIFLNLYSWPDIKCLIDGKKHENDVIAFSKLVELSLFKMDNVEDLYQDCLPSNFLEQLEIMRLRHCHKLRNIFFDGKLSTCYLKVMELVDCPKWTSIFPSVTAQRLRQLEKLTITNCDSLEHIIELGDDNDEKSFDSLFPKLKNLKVEGCGRLKIVLPILVCGDLALSLEKIRIHKCEQLNYLFDKFKKEDRIMLPSLKEMDLSQVPSFINIFREYHHHGTTSLSIQRPLSPPRVPRKNNPAIIFSWAQMCCFCHKSSEETNVILCKDKVPNYTIHEGSFASMKSFEIIMRQLGHVKELKLSHMSSNLISLSMTSSILWEELTIEEFDGLKHLITIEANDCDKDQMMSCHSIFPKLKKLEIIKCKDLEFLFLSTVSVQLENLKSLIVKNAPELKYVVGKYHHMENHSSNVELHFKLPALELIHLEDMPKLISILAKNYSLSWPSLQDVTLENRNIESFTDDLLVCSEGQLNKKPMKELDASINAMPPIQATRCLSIQSLNHVKEMTLLNFSNLRTLLTLPMATMILWEKLKIKRCGQLKYIMADEEDVGALMNNHRPIFPKLKMLIISECDALEYLFTANAFRSPTHLKYLSIKNASELKYVFGTSHHENQNMQTCIDFPALENLFFKSLPKLISFCPRNYCPRGLSLKSFDLASTPEFDIKSLTGFMVCAFGGQLDYSTHAEEMKMLLRSLNYVVVRESRIEEIFDLTHMDTHKIGEGHEQQTSNLMLLWLQDLSELKNICVGPNCILSLNNISRLDIIRCNKLKVVFSDSILKSLPKLGWLLISSCEELTHIVEENVDDNDHLCHEPCFPVLFSLTVEHCNKLKYLFSITVSGILPKLKFLNIKESSNLEHVFIRKDETKEKVMMDVLPQIKDLKLDKVSSLISICSEIDFQTLEQSSEVHDCPQFSFYETTTPQVQDGSKFIDSQSLVVTKQKISSHINMEEVNEKQGFELRQFSTLLPKDELVGKEVKNKGIMMDPQQSTIGTSNITNDDELAGKEKKNEKTKIDPQQPTNGTSKWRKTNKEEGYSDIIEDLNSDTIEMTDQLTGSEPINTMATRHVSVSQDASSKDELVGKDEKKEMIVMDTHSLPKTRIVEERHEECISRETIDPSSSASKKKPLVPKSQNLDVLSVGGITSKTIELFEPEEEEEGTLIATRSQRSSMKAKGSSSGKEHWTSLQGNPSVPPLPTSPKQIPSSTPSKSTHGRNILHNIESTKQPSHETTDTIQDYGMTPSFYDTNDASSVLGVQEIVDMMKLEGIEPSMLAEAFKTHPQLRLSSENRSTKLLCFSYRVLLNILNIMAIRTPFTITEAEKRLLVEYLNDASTIGFDKDWLEYVRIKVFHCDVSEVPRMQQVLEGLGNKLHNRKTELAIAQKELEAAQQQHARARTHHSQLLQECQEILEQRDQCWKTIAAKFRPFGF